MPVGGAVAAQMLQGGARKRRGCVMMAYDVIDQHGRMHAVMTTAAAVGAERWSRGSA